MSVKVLFFWIPVAVFAFPHLFLVTGGYDRWIMPVPREIGYVENATALFFLIGGVYAFGLIWNDVAKRVKFLRGCMFLFGAAAVFVCLEEVSYGQHFLHFNTPDWFLENNKNRELNLHNLGQDKPAYTLRSIGYAIVALVGIVAPLVVKYRKIEFAKDNLLRYSIPTVWMIVPSLFHLFANLPKNIVKLLPDGDEIIRASYYFGESGEYEEYMFGLWVILFVVSAHMAFRREASAE